LGFVTTCQTMSESTQIAATIDGIDYSSLTIHPEYMDANGHLNVGYYGVIFDQAVDLPLIALGAYGRIDSEGISYFVLESHLTFQRELKAGDPISFVFQLLDYDAKRAHYILTMKHAVERWTASTCEQMLMCIDLSTRRGRAWPEEVMQNISALHGVHRNRARPEEVGRPIGIRRKAT